MARTQAQVKGDALEDAVHFIEMVILDTDPGAVDSPITIERKKIVTVQGVRHEIDIYITINNGKGYLSTFIFECKNWKKKVDKDEIIVFARKVADVRATKGFFVARRFTSDAIAQAERDAVELLTADDVVDALPSFLENFQVPSYSVIVEDCLTNFIFPTSSEAANIQSELNEESFVKYEAEGMLLGKLILILQQQVLDEHAANTRSETKIEDNRRYKYVKTIGFSPGELIIEGHECLAVELHVVWEWKIVRPPIVSTFDIKTRGRVITLATESSPLGGVIEISFISTHV